MSTKTFTINKNTPIGWGKHKGKPHSDLLLPENKSYAKWICDQGSDFRYSSSRDWIIANQKNTVQELTPSEWKRLTTVKRELTEEEEKSVDHFNKFLIEMDSKSTVDGEVEEEEEEEKE